MKRVIVWLATLLTLAVVSTGCTPESRLKLADPPAPRPVKLLDRYDVAVIGDSFTGGSSSGGQGKAGWPFAVWDQLQRFDNMSVNPKVSAEGNSGYVAIGDRDGVYGSHIDELVDRKTALAVFFGSRNDYSRDAALVGPAAAAAFAEVRRVAPQARILVVGPLWTTNDSPEPFIYATRDALEGAANLAGATFVDPIGLRWLRDTPNLIGVDGTYPNDAGHQYLAAKFLPLVKAELLQADPSTVQ